MARYGILLLILTSVLAMMINGQNTAQYSQCTDSTQLKEMVAEDLNIDKENLDINRENLELNRKTYEAVRQSTLGQGEGGQTVPQCPRNCNGLLVLSGENPVGYDLTASSEAVGLPVERSVLNTIKSDNRSCWGIGPNDASKWIQVDMRTPHKVMAVLTQGRYAGDGWPQWVTKYTISYSTDIINWTNYTDGHLKSNYPTVFYGNKGDTDLKLNMFLTPFVAIYVRLHPTAWNGYISLRWDILACPI